MWRSVEDAQMRLTGCVVRYKDDPVYIHSVNHSEARGIYASLSILGTDDQVRRGVNDPEWDYRPIPTGYMNYGHNAFYITRIPIRKWKQGLHADNVVSLPGTRRVMDLVRTEEFKSVVKNLYPTFDDINKMVRLGMKGGAFHRKFCLRRGMYAKVPMLEYMGEVVGMVQDGKPELLPQFLFLTEELQEAVA